MVHPVAIIRVPTDLATLGRTEEAASCLHRAFRYPVLGFRGARSVTMTTQAIASKIAAMSNAHV